LCVFSKGTIGEKPQWDVEGAAEKVYNACKGLGTTEEDIIDVVCSINNAQRQVLREKFLAMYGEVRNLHENEKRRYAV
jgi:hypothetical protein